MHMRIHSFMKPLPQVFSHTLTPQSNRPTLLVSLLCACLCLMLSTGCRTKRVIQEAPRARAPYASEKQDNSTSQGVPRPDPGYVQWLKKQSMLHQASGYSHIVSDKNLQWRNAGNAPHPAALVKEASAWLTLNPASVLTPDSKPLFAYLRNDVFWQKISQLGFTGLQLSPVRESGGVWGHQISRTMSLGEDAVCYAFSKSTGGGNAYSAFTNKAVHNGVILGDTLIPLATGMGADFFLALRGHEDYAGTYSLIEIPPSLWEGLPQPEQGSYVITLAPEDIAFLRTQKILPAPFRRKTSGIPFPTVTWAVTGKIRGVDGNIRRFAYLYYKTPNRPVLNWTDPAAAARRILSASVIQETGILGSALVGMQISPLIGLEPTTPQNRKMVHGLADVAVEAAETLAREVRRYGGWSYLQDSLPLPLLSTMLQRGPDFAINHAGSVGAQLALLTGDITMLATSLNAMHALHIDRSRLIHTIQPAGGVDLSLLHLAGASGESIVSLRRKAAKQLLEKITITGAEGYVDGTTLYSTPAGVVAIAAGIAELNHLSNAQTQKLHDGMSTLALFHAMQPGLFFASGRDITGTLPLPEGIVPSTTRSDGLQQNVTGAYDLLGTAQHTLMTAFSIPKAKSLFGPIPEQSVVPDSFINRLHRALLIRKHYKVEQSVPLGIIPSSNQGTLLQVFALPDSQKLLLVASNFAQKDSQESISLTRGTLATYNVQAAIELLGNGENLALVAKKSRQEPNAASVPEGTPNEIDSLVNTPQNPPQKTTTENNESEKPMHANNATDKLHTSEKLIMRLQSWETRVVLLEGAASK